MTRLCKPGSEWFWMQLSIFDFATFVKSPALHILLSSDNLIRQAAIKKDSTCRLHVDTSCLTMHWGGWVVAALFLFWLPTARIAKTPGSCACYPHRARGAVLVPKQGRPSDSSFGFSKLVESACITYSAIWCYRAALNHWIKSNIETENISKRFKKIFEWSWHTFHFCWIHACTCLMSHVPFVPQELTPPPDLSISKLLSRFSRSWHGTIPSKFLT